MITISRAGSMRSPVVVVGWFALKFARNARGPPGTTNALIGRYIFGIGQPCLSFGEQGPWTPGILQRPY